MAELGLFTDPQQLREAMLMQQAKMTPQETINYMALKGGQGLGEAIGGMFGVNVQDPAIARATKLRELGAKYGTTTAEALDKIAADLQQTDPQMAMQVAAKAADMRKSVVDLQAKQAETQYKQATTMKTMEDISSVGKAMELAKTGKYTSDSITKYLSGQGELVSIDKDVKPTADFVAVANELGYGAKTTYGAYTPEQTARVNAELQSRAVQKQIAGANRMSVIQQQESSFAKERGQLQAKALGEAETQAKASANAVSRLASMESLNKGSMITGPLAGTAIGAGQFLSSLGLLSPDSAKTLSSSEIYDKQAKDLVMQDLGGKLGAQISNADRDFIEARIPQLRNSQQARTELIAKLKEIHKKNIDYYQRMSKHANTKGNLNEFDFASGAPETKTNNLGTKENPIKLQ